MAYQDALFQLGMDLTRSSTAQKEDNGETARVAHNFEPVSGRHEGRKYDFIERDSVRYAGNQLIIDLFGSDKLDDLDYVEDTLKRCVEVAGATLLHVHLHRQAPVSGVAGVAVLAEGHISFHSWPHHGYAALDIFMSGDAKAHLCVDVLEKAFSAAKVVVKAHKRGATVERLAIPAAVSTTADMIRSDAARPVRARSRVRRAA